MERHFTPTELDTGKIHIDSISMAFCREVEFCCFVKGVTGKSSLQFEKVTQVGGVHQSSCGIIESIQEASHCDRLAQQKHLAMNNQFSRSHSSARHE